RAGPRGVLPSRGRHRGRFRSRAGVSGDLRQGAGLDRRIATMIPNGNSLIALLAAGLCALAAPPPAAALQIFYGTTLARRDGDTAVWRVEKGAMVGETT